MENNVEKFSFIELVKPSRSADRKAGKFYTRIERSKLEIYKKELDGVYDELQWLNRNPFFMNIMGGYYKKRRKELLKEIKDVKEVIQTKKDNWDKFTKKLNKRLRNKN